MYRAEFAKALSSLRLSGPSGSANFGGYSPAIHPQALKALGFSGVGE